MATMKIKKKATLYKVIAGKDINNEGKVIAVNAKNNTLLVEGINMVTKHTKPSMSNQQGGIVHQEAPIDASNVMCSSMTESLLVLVSRWMEIRRYVSQNQQAKVID